MAYFYLYVYGPKNTSVPCPGRGFALFPNLFLREGQEERKCGNLFGDTHLAANPEFDGVDGPGGAVQQGRDILGIQIHDNKRANPVLPGGQSGIGLVQIGEECRMDLFEIELESRPLVLAPSPVVQSPDTGGNGGSVN